MPGQFPREGSMVKVDQEGAEKPIKYRLLAHQLNAQLPARYLSPLRV
jgi:hypothetical protein